MFHYRKSRNKYVSFPKSEICPFCHEQELHHPKIRQEKYSYLAPNRVFYDLWELREVQDHLMLIPNRHVKSLHDLNKQEQAEIIRLIGEYENKGYNVYARAKDSNQRSVGHQHTHLIKTESKMARA